MAHYTVHYWIDHKHEPRRSAVLEATSDEDAEKKAHDHVRGLRALLRLMPHKVRMLSVNRV